MTRVFRSELWLAVASAALLLACGARSALLDSTRASDDSGLGGNASGGTQGGSGGGGGGTGAIGGGGLGGMGGSPDCNAFALLEPIVYVGNPGNNEDFAPAFVAAANDPANVTLAFVRRPGVDLEIHGELRHVTFAPWGNWPPDPELGPGFTSFTDTTLLDEFRVTSSAVGFLGAAAVIDDVVHVAPRVSSSSDGTGVTAALLGTKPVFASTLNENTFLVGTLSIQRELYVQILESTLEEFITIATIGCADQDIVGGAVPATDGWLLAHSNGKDAPAAVCGPSQSGSAGPPTRIDIIELGKGMTTELRLSIPVSSSVRELAVAPHPAGIALIWVEELESNVPVLRFARYEAASATLIGPVSVTEAFDDPTGIALAPFGDRFVVAYRHTESLVTKLLDASGASLASFAFSPDVRNTPALVTNPNQGSVLLAFESGAAQLMEVARLECVK